VKTSFISRSGLAIVLTCLISSNCAPHESPLPDGANGRIVKVIDGDTVDVSISGRTERVRLIGIDTPETKKPNTPIQCFGPEASDHTKELLPIGTPVLVQRDVEARDPYGRLLGYIYRSSDQLFVNEELIVNGFARPLSIAPNTAFTSQFAE
jgi:micrococcal nuclease